MVLADPTRSGSTFVVVSEVMLDCENYQEEKKSIQMDVSLCFLAWICVSEVLKHSLVDKQSEFSGKNLQGGHETMLFRWPNYSLEVFLCRIGFHSNQHIPQYLYNLS